MEYVKLQLKTNIVNDSPKGCSKSAKIEYFSFEIPFFVIFIHSAIDCSWYLNSGFIQSVVSFLLTCGVLYAVRVLFCKLRYSDPGT